MRTNALNSSYFILPAALVTPVVIVFSLLLFVYGVFNFSAHHWIFVSLVIVAVMAVLDRISNVKNMTYKLNKQASYTDGGAFSHEEQSNHEYNGRPVVQDGGIFKIKIENNF